MKDVRYELEVFDTQTGKGRTVEEAHDVPQDGYHHARSRNCLCVPSTYAGGLDPKRSGTGKLYVHHPMGGPL